MNKDLTRRHFLVTTGAVAATVLGRPFLFDIDSAYSQTQCPVTGGAFVRRDVGGLAATDPIIISYRKAIAAMKALPSTNPLSWGYQAAIHGTCMAGNMLAWNTCEHGIFSPGGFGSPYFFVWHRMYLYWFERIIRKMSCDPGWALPYWNWHCPSQRNLPAMFRDPNIPELYVASSDMQCFTPGRPAAVNNGSFALQDSDVDISSLTDLVFYSSFTGFDIDFQQLPHNQIHGMLGGWMGDPQTAARDPIFFLHHANIDRYWNLWLAQGGSRSDPVTDNQWTTYARTFFCEDGTPVTMKSCDVLQAKNQLGYAYEDECTQVNQTCRVFSGGWVLDTIFVLELNIPPFSLGSEKVTVPIGVLPPQFLQVSENGQKANLQLGNVEALHSPGVSWEVYVGLPSGAAPSPDSPYYVGLVSLFATGIRNQSHHGFQPAFFNFVMNRALLAVPNVALSLTFVLHPLLINGKLVPPPVQSSVTIGKVSLVITKEVLAEPSVSP